MCRSKTGVHVAGVPLWVRFERAHSPAVRGFHGYGTGPSLALVRGGRAEVSRGGVPQSPEGTRKALGLSNAFFGARVNDVTDPLEENITTHGP